MLHPDTFKPDGPAYARVDVLFRGTKYLAGEEFPHRDLAVPKARLQALWNSRLIAFGEPPEELALAAMERREQASAKDVTLDPPAAPSRRRKR